MPVRAQRPQVEWLESRQMQLTHSHGWARLVSEYTKSKGAFCRSKRGGESFGCLASRLSSYSRSRRSIEPEATRPVLRIRTSRGAEGLDEDKQRQCIEWQSVKRLVEAGNLGYPLLEGTGNQSLCLVVMQTGTSCINLIEKEEGLERKLMPLRTMF